MNLAKETGGFLSSNAFLDFYNLWFARKQTEELKQYDYIGVYFSDQIRVVDDKEWMSIMAFCSVIKMQEITVYQNMHGYFERNLKRAKETPLKTLLFLSALKHSKNAITVEEFNSCHKKISEINMEDLINGIDLTSMSLKEIEFLMLASLHLDLNECDAKLMKPLLGRIPDILTELSVTTALLLLELQKNHLMKVQKNSKMKIFANLSKPFNEERIECTANELGLSEEEVLFLQLEIHNISKTTFKTVEFKKKSLLNMKKSFVEEYAQSSLDVVDDSMKDLFIQYFKDYSIFLKALESPSMFSFEKLKSFTKLELIDKVILENECYKDHEFLSNNGIIAFFNKDSICYHYDWKSVVTLQGLVNNLVNYYRTSDVQCRALLKDIEETKELSLPKMSMALCTMMEHAGVLDLKNPKTYPVKGIKTLNDIVAKRLINDLNYAETFIVYMDYYGWPMSEEFKQLMHGPMHEFIEEIYNSEDTQKEQILKYVIELFWKFNPAGYSRILFEELKDPKFQKIMDVTEEEAYKIREMFYRSDSMGHLDKCIHAEDFYTEEERHNALWTAALTEMNSASIFDMSRDQFYKKVKQDCFTEDEKNQINEKIMNLLLNSADSYSMRRIVRIEMRLKKELGISFIDGVIENIKKGEENGNNT